MKKIILILLVLTRFASYSQSSESIKFKISYNPETSYRQSMKQTTHVEMQYSGSEDYLKILKEKSINNPIIVDNDNNSELVIQTGKSTDNSNFPLTIEFVNSTSKNGIKVIPNGTLIYGHCSKDTLFTLDSIVSDGLEENFKTMFLQLIQKTMSQFIIPEKNVKVGESFFIENPLSIPIGGMKIEMNIITNYTLLKINNGIAEFDIFQVFKVISTMSDITNNSKGSGKGKLMYDIKENFSTKYQIETEMEMNMKLDNINLDLKTKTGIDIETEIKRNNDRK